MKARLRELRDERGASAVIVGVSLFALMGMLLLTLDAGSLWTARRDILTGTDSAALAAAHTVTTGGTTTTACNNYGDVIKKSAGAESFPVSCSLGAGSTAEFGYVVVEGRKPSPVRFGGLFGIGDKQPYSLSAARWGYASSVGGLRPIGICTENTHIQGYLGNGPDVGIHPPYLPLTTPVHRIMYTKDNPNACGGDAPGNWGFIDLDSGANSNADLTDWILNGYDEEVAVGDCDPTTPAADPCEGDTGSSGGSIANDLQKLVTTGEVFTIILFDSVSGSGATTRYNVWAFLGVKLRGFRVSGAAALRYLDLEFLRTVRPGKCCSRTGRTPVFAMALCTVDHDPQSEASRCMS